MRRPAFALALLVLLGTATACSGAPMAPARTPTADEMSGTLTVFAAASLEPTFSTLADDFEKKYPGTTVRLSFAGSSDLETQISQGAPADVFASADTATMDKLREANLLAGQPKNFATNVLTIAVPPGNPAGITSFADLARPGVAVVICAAQVPCGAATKKLEDSTGTTLTPVSEEASVTDVLGKVVAGEADAGLVYITDVRSAGARVREIPFPQSSTAVNTYPIGVVGSGAHSDLAAAFVAMVTGAQGRSVLSAAGFGVP